VWDLRILEFSRSGEEKLKVAYNPLKLKRDGIRLDRVGRVGNSDGMGQGIRITGEEPRDLIDLYPIDPTLHGT
jgi:hypothetical protein